MMSSSVAMGLAHSTLIIWTDQMFTRRAMSCDIKTYPIFVFSMSWFAASDQFRQLSLVWRRHKFKAKLRHAETHVYICLKPCKNPTYHILLIKVNREICSVFNKVGPLMSNHARNSLLNWSCVSKPRYRYSRWHKHLVAKPQYRFIDRKKSFFRKLVIERL